MDTLIRNVYEEQKILNKKGDFIDLKTHYFDFLDIKLTYKEIENIQNLSGTN